MGPLSDPRPGPIDRNSLSKRNKKNPAAKASDSVPQEFLQRLRRIVPEHFQSQVVDSLYQPKNVSFRWNPLLSENKQKVLEALGQANIAMHPITWFEDAYSVASEQRQMLLESSPANRSEIYIQNPSSYLPCLILDPQPDEQVLDLAAAPGGKTLLMAAMMNNRGLLSAVEAIRNRFFKLNANLKRYGATNTRTYLKDGRTVGRKVANRFDRVLIDTPCSGESRIHASEPESYQFWSLRKLKEQARKQFGLIRSAFEALKPGGKLVYCTCSFAPEENEQIISDFLENQVNAELTDIKIPAGINWQAGLTDWNDRKMHPDIEKTVRIIPDEILNGFFIAAIEKTE